MSLSVRKVLPRAGQFVRCIETKPTGKSVPDVPGLSKNVVAVPSEDVGPGASKSSNYKNPEYFSYNVFSYFEAEVEMLKHRLPQPSSKK